MNRIVTTLIFVLFCATGFAQDAIMQLKLEKAYEEAETAFSKEDYKTTLAKLNEFEKLFGGATNKSLYLRAMARSNRFFKEYNNNWYGFTMGGEIKVNPRYYLDDVMAQDYAEAVKYTNKYMEVMKSKGIDDKLKEIFDTSEKLNALKLYTDKAKYLSFRERVKQRWFLETDELAEILAKCVPEPVKVVSVKNGVLTLAVANVEPAINSKGVGKRNLVDLSITIDFNNLTSFNEGSMYSNSKTDVCKFKRVKIVKSADNSVVYPDNCNFYLHSRDKYAYKGGRITVFIKGLTGNNSPMYSGSSANIQLFDKDSILKLEENIEWVAKQNSLMQIVNVTRPK